MTTTGRIPTPWKHKWRRFRYSAMPVLCFLVCVAITVWLWRDVGQVAGSVAVVEQKSIPVAASADGKLVAPPGKSGDYWKPFDTVGKGQLIARLDDSILQSSLKARRQELVGLDKEVRAAAEQIRIDSVGREHERTRHRLNLIVQAETSRIDVLDRTATIEVDLMTWQRLDASVQSKSMFVGRQIISPLELELVQMERDEVAKRIKSNRLALKEAQAVAAEAKQRLEEYPAVDQVTIKEEALLGPVRAQIATQDALIDELLQQVEALNIIAPFSGAISAIHCWPNQFVRRGDPIVTLAAIDVPENEDQPKVAVAYIRPEQRIQPYEGMKVLVRSRAAGNSRVDAQVEQVGPQFEPVPLEHLLDPTVPEWGRPTRIQLPIGFDVVPGEVLDVKFVTSAKQS